MDTTFDAHVQHVGTFIDPANRTFKLTVHVPRGAGFIRPNLLSDISIMDQRIDSAIVVPAAAVLEDVEGHDYVFVLDAAAGGDARATKLPVRRVSEHKGQVCIEPAPGGSLAEGMQVITEGARNVSNGQMVRITGL